MTHVTEEQLNLYLDQVLSPQELAAVETHLARCATCRTELELMQSLFVRLDTLPADPLMVDLAPRVLNDVASERQRTQRRRRMAWGVLGLQAITIITLLLFGWSMLTQQFVELTRYIPPTTLTATWANLSIEGNLVWHTIIAQWQIWWTEIATDILSLPAGLKPIGDSWPEFPGWGLPTSQVAIVGLAALLMWLVGNSIILRTVTTRPIPDGQPKH